MDKNLFKLKGFKSLSLFLAAMTFVQVAAIIGQATWLAEAISALFAGESLQEQSSKLVLFLLAFLMRHVVALLQQKAAYRFAEHTGAAMRKQLMQKLFKLGPRFTKTKGTGNIVTLVLEGIAQYRTYLELIIPRMLGTAIIPATIVIYVWMQDRISALILIFTLPILIVFLILVGLAARKQAEGQWRSFRVLSNHFVDSLRGLETLKVLGRSRDHVHSIKKVSDRFRSATMRTLRVAFLSSFALDFFTMLSVASVAVSLGLRLINGQLTLVTGLTVLILAPEYFLPVRMVGADYHATLNGKEAGKDMQSILDQPDSNNGNDQDEHYEPKSVLAVAANGDMGRFSWTSESMLACSSLTVQHDLDQPPSLEDLAIELRGFQMIGIVGESGAGKSTLIDVLGGFLQPSVGQFRVNGAFLSQLADIDWQSQITYIPQHPYIFSCSLAENVRFYRPNASDEEVEQAVVASGLGELEASLPNGMHEVIGNGGRALSGGQEQRVALARALLSDRPIILLDEPTAHLDIETEVELKETMLKLFANRLVVLATHRLHWMQDMDTIVVLQQGKRVEAGSHEQLMAKQGVYYEMIKAQWEGIGS